MCMRRISDVACGESCLRAGRPVLRPCSYWVGLSYIPLCVVTEQSSDQLSGGAGGGSVWPATSCRQMGTAVLYSGCRDSMPSLPVVCFFLWSCARFAPNQSSLSKGCPESRSEVAESAHSVWAEFIGSRMSAREWPGLHIASNRFWGQLAWQPHEAYDHKPRQSLM